MGKKILVIDDEPAIRKSFILALEETAYEVFAADSGEAGIRILEKGAFDLVFLDLKMPGLNGIQTLYKLREIDSKVPVYIVTAFYQEFLKELNAAEKDNIAFEVLRKPIGADDILMITRSLLEEAAGS